MLSKSRSILKLEKNGVSANSADFCNRDDDTQQIYYEVILPRSQWDEMGEPDTITITIEPGDKLNG
jgi:hypothetical protein